MNTVRKRERTVAASAEFINRIIKAFPIMSSPKCTVPRE
jgi:hypothetical protein